MLYGATEQNFLDGFGGRLHYACPSGWLIYTYRGRDYHLDDDIADPEIIMKASLGQGKNLLIKKAPPRRGINPIPFMSRKRGRRKSGVLALHFGAPGMGNN